MEKLFFHKLVLLLFAFVAISYRMHAIATTTHPSDLICHSKGLQDCYPRVFEPTWEFQMIHDDQEIPSGLHVRMNLETGLKEAKLYDGNSESDESLLANTIEVTAGGSASNAVLSLPESDQEADSEPGPKIPEQLLQHLMDPSPHRPMKPTLDSDADGSAFAVAVSSLTSSTSRTPEAILPALAVLEDLGHDVYWGLSLVQEMDAIHSLRLLLHDSNPEVAGAAALTLGNAIHNNPGSLKHLNNQETNSLTAIYHTTMEALGLFQSTSPHPLSSPSSSRSLPPRVYSRIMYLLSSLCQDPAILLDFTRSHGLTALLSSAHFDAGRAGSDEGWDRPRRQVADFVADHYLAIGSSGTEAYISEEEEKGRSAAADGWVRVDSPPSVYCELAEWCRAFEKALNGWEAAAATAGDMQTSNGAKEHVEEAYRLLPDVLATKGYSCTSCGV